MLVDWMDMKRAVLKAEKKVLTDKSLADKKVFLLAGLLAD
jgi:hypothetical protein